MNYNADDVIICSPFDHTTIGRYLADQVANFDIFHLHARPMFYQGPKHFFFPTFHDLVMLKAAGKKICFHFRGSEVRYASAFREKNPFHYVDDDPDRIFKKFLEPVQLAYIDFIRAFADRIFVTDPELQTYVPGSQIVPRIFEPLENVNARPLRRTNPVIVHAPSRRGVKGTAAVLAAVEALRAEGLRFEFRLIEGLSSADAVQAYADSDIIVDQLRIGWYGVLAVEGFALARAVVSYIRDDLVPSLGNPLPLINANPLVIRDVLRRSIEDYDYRQAKASAGHAWFRRTHSSSSIVPLLSRHYEEVLSAPNQFDQHAFQRLVELQIGLQTKQGAVHGIQPISSMTLAQKFMHVWRMDGPREAFDVTGRFLKRRWKS